MDLTHEDVQNILKLIDGSSLEELHLEIGDFKLVVRKRRGASPSTDGAGEAAVETPAAVAATPPPSAARRESEVATVAGGPAPARVPAGGFELTAPMVGTFYRAPSPGAPPFVEEGRVVDADDTVCIIEVMKLMNSIKAGRRGRVAAILAENGALVEYGQTLMVIEPLEGAA